jgi:hypothetical protein
MSEFQISTSEYHWRTCEHLKLCSLTKPKWVKSSPDEDGPKVYSWLKTEAVITNWLVSPTANLPAIRCQDYAKIFPCWSALPRSQRKQRWKPRKRREEKNRRHQSLKLNHPPSGTVWYKRRSYSEVVPYECCRMKIQITEVLKHFKINVKYAATPNIVT